METNTIKGQIYRLGFGAWAENVIVNYIEDWGDVMRNSEKGTHSIEKKEYDLNAQWDENKLHISIRAYIEGDGWQSLEQNIKIK